jgi:hypothetical protein
MWFLVRSLLYVICEPTSIIKRVFEAAWTSTLCTCMLLAYTGVDIYSIECTDVLILLIPKTSNATTELNRRHSEIPGPPALGRVSIVTASPRFLLVDHQMTEVGIQNSFENDTAMPTAFSLSPGFAANSDSCASIYKLVLSDH